MIDYTDTSKFPASQTSDALLEINDISSSTYANMVKYQGYISNNKFSEASALLQSDSDLKKCIVNASVINTIQERIKILQEYSMSLKSQSVISNDYPSDDSLNDFRLNGCLWSRRVSEDNADIYVEDYIKYNNKWYKKRSNSIDANIGDINTLTVSDGITVKDAKITGSFSAINGIFSGTLMADNIIIGDIDITSQLASVNTQIADMSNTLSSYDQRISTATEIGFTVSDSLLYDSNTKTLGVKTASSNTSGVVKIGANITCSDGTISISKNDIENALGYSPADAANIGTGSSSSSSGGDVTASANNTFSGINKFTNTTSFTGNVKITGATTLSGIAVGGSATFDSVIACSSAINLKNSGGTTIGQLKQNSNNLYLISDGYPIYVKTDKSIAIESAKGKVYIRSEGQVFIGDDDNNTKGVAYDYNESTKNEFFRPVKEGKCYLGTASYRWTSIYAQKATIQTSDRNEKNTICLLNDKYERLFNKLQPVSFKFNNGNRTHTGFVAQDVETAMLSIGLNYNDFAALYKETVNEDGEEVEKYALRYSEFISLNTYMIQKLQQRVTELETKLAEVSK